MTFFSLFSSGKYSRKNKNQQENELAVISFSDLSKKAYEYLNRQQDICTGVYKIGGYGSWYYDQCTGELTFSDDGIKKLIIDYEAVGSLSEETNTFLWSWANPHVEDKVKSEIVSVRDYGTSRGFEKLMTGKWTADQYDGWEMTAIAACLLKAKGAYRVPVNDGKLFSFMIFKNIRRVDNINP